MLATSFLPRLHTAPESSLFLPAICFNPWPAWKSGELGKKNGDILLFSYHLQFPWPSEWMQARFKSQLPGHTFDPSKRTVRSAPVHTCTNLLNLRIGHIVIDPCEPRLRSGHRPHLQRGSASPLAPGPCARPSPVFGSGHLGCCRFQRHRVRCMNETGGKAWSDGSLRESLSWRR